jgi:excisionase family DNA binding protein
MENGKSTSREKELLAAADVAELIGVKETTVYRWCKQGKLPCLKVPSGRPRYAVRAP